jgi:hypothetical protein
MPKIVHLSMGLFNPETHLVNLAETAALHELVLISAHHVMAAGRLAVLRQALAPRRLMALLIADDLPPIERTFIDELLNDGVIPVIVPLGDGPTAALMFWLDDAERSAPCADHRRDGHRTQGSVPQLRAWRRASPGNDAGELRPAA